MTGTLSDTIEPPARGTLQESRRFRGQNPETGPLYPGRERILRRLRRCVVRRAPTRPTRMDNGRMQFKVQNANCKRQGGGDGHNHGWTVTGCNSKCKMQTARGKMAKTGVKEPRIQGVEWRGIEGQGNRRLRDRLRAYPRAGRRRDPQAA
jgi:hypothetical protein